VDADGDEAGEVADGACDGVEGAVIGDEVAGDGAAGDGDADGEGDAAETGGRDGIVADGVALVRPLLRNAVHETTVPAGTARMGSPRVRTGPPRLTVLTVRRTPLGDIVTARCRIFSKH
jgi:hypothetical protein